MQGALDFLVPVVLAAVVLVLAVGLVGLFRGGEFNRRWGNVLMRWRVGLQALAILLIALAVFVFSR